MGRADVVIGGSWRCGSFLKFDREAGREAAAKIRERAQTRSSGAGRRAIKVNTIRPLFNQSSTSEARDFTPDSRKFGSSARSRSSAEKLLFPGKLSLRKLEIGISRGSLKVTVVREANTRSVNASDASPLGDFTKKLPKKSGLAKVSGPQRKKTGARKQLASCCSVGARQTHYGT